MLAVYRLVSTIIQRHLKIRGKANPYDPSYTEYFQKRLCFVWRVGWGGRKTEAVAACS